MKKAAAILLIICMIPFVLVGCKTEQNNSTPVIQTSFNQTAKVTQGGTTYPCRISRTDTADLVVEMLEGAPNAGVVYACSENNTMVTLDNMTFTFLPEELQENALIYTLTSLFNAMARKEGVAVERTKDGFQYQGNCSAGPFTLNQRRDYSYDKIQVGSFQIQFDA